MIKVQTLQPAAGHLVDWNWKPISISEQLWLWLGEFLLGRPSITKRMPSLRAKGGYGPLRLAPLGDMLDFQAEMEPSSPCDSLPDVSTVYGP